MSPAIWIVGVRNAVRWQAICGFIAAGVVGFGFGVIPGLSAAYGVLLSLLNGLWLLSRIKQANAMDYASCQRSLYTGAVIRFMVFLLALVVAGVIGLHLLAVAAGLMVAQAGMFAYAAGKARNELNGQILD